MTKPQSACDDCVFHNVDSLKKLGIDTSDTDFVVALAGNPNTGKSTVFNALTGLRQHTGNWPGKTVVRAEGGFKFDNNKYKIIDLPGTYSLLSTSQDEEVARNFILFGKPDVTVIVADATRLELNLNLVLQILEITDKAILCVNLIDEAERHHIKIDERQLAKKLGIPVVLTAARSQRGIPQLLSIIADMASGKIVNKARKVKTLKGKLEEAVKRLTDEIEKQFPGLPNSRWVAFRLLEGDQRITEAVLNNELKELI